MKTPFKSCKPGRYKVQGDVSEAQIMDMALKLVNRRLGKRRDLSNPKAVRKYLAVKLAEMEHEIFTVIFLNNRHQIILFETMFRGTIDGTSVYSREVVKRSLELNAAAVIFAHNHPSGNAEPSQADITITKRLTDALGLVDIRVLDHFVIGGNDVVSLAELGHV